MRRTGLILLLCLAGSATPGCKDSGAAFSKVGEAKNIGPERAHTGGVPPLPQRGVDDALEIAANPAPPPAGLAEPIVGKEKAVPPKSKPLTTQSGVLTAGSFDDNVDPLVFASFTRKFSQQQGLGDLPGKLQGQRLLVLVKDVAGKPIGNARVKLAAGTSTPVELITRSDGRAVFVLSWDQLPAGQKLQATVTDQEGLRTMTETISAGAPRWEITLPGAQASLPKSLDLAIVLDTTGSMGDELEYLKREIHGISAEVAKKFPGVRQRFALVLYRDEGDEYVVRRFDFTESVSEFHKRLSGQSAGGGGDYPEAMHKGMEEALQLRWQEKDSARVLFLIADAPPHPQHIARTMAAANNLRKKGVAIYPVACSGYDDACELVMRSCALLTGSQFLFLTDDSGVGDKHAEPKIPYYAVERLDRLMVRLISSELSGQRIQANPADILRTVGKKVN